MHVGAGAVHMLLRRSSWAWPLAAAWSLPGFPPLADRAYAWVADHHYLLLGRNVPAACADGACAIHLGRPRNTATAAGNNSRNPGAP